MSAAARAGTSSRLPLGTVVGGRFRIEAYLRTEAGTELYQAADTEVGGPSLLRLIPDAPPAVRAALEEDLTQLAPVQHRNLVAVRSFGDAGGHLFVAVEAEEAHSVRELIDARRSQGQTVGATYAHTLLGHVANGLGELYRYAPHGGLNPEAILVSQNGRVKIADVGLSRAIPALGRRGGPAGAPEGLYLAPEVARGSAPSAAGDVYSLGAILYELVTGVPPALPMRPPSQVVSDVPPALDAVVARALAPNAPARFPTPADLVAALAAVLEAPGAAPVPPPRLTLGRSFDPAQAAGMNQSDERWLVQKDRLDFGPFSLQQVMAQLERGVFGPENYIVDVDSGERQKIKEHPLLGDFAIEAERRLEAARRAQADQVQETVERKKSRATVVILGLVLAGLGAGAFVYFKSRKAAEVDVLASRVAEEDVDAFIRQFKLDVPTRKKATARRGGGRGDDFDGATVLGDVTQGGGDEILSDAIVQKVMLGNYRKLVPCIMRERGRNAGLSDIDIEFVVLGSGKVSAVRVNGQRNGDFPACVLKSMQSFGFPSFNGKKTIASWSLSMR